MVEQNEEFVKLLFEDCVIESEKMFFFAKNLNGLFVMDLKNGHTKFLGKIPVYEFRDERLVVKLIKIENVIYLIPMAAEEVWMFSLETFEWEKIYIKKFEEKKIYGKFLQAIHYEKNLFLFGAGYPAIVCIDLKSNAVTYVEGVYDEIKEKQVWLKDCYVRTDYVLKDNQIYMSSCIANKVLIFDLKTKHYSWKNVGGEENRYAGITWDGQYFWLAPRCKTNVVRWNGKNKIDEYKLGTDFLEDKYNFLGAIYDGKNICLPGMDNDSSLFFDPYDLEKIKVIKQRYLAYKSLPNNYIVSLTMEGYLCVKCNEERIWSGYCGIKKREFFEKYQISLNITHETDILNLQVFISYMLNKIDELDFNRDDVGKNIYSKLKGE